MGIAQLVCAILPLFSVAQNHLKLTSISSNIGIQRSQYVIKTATSSEITGPPVVLYPRTFGVVLEDSLYELQLVYKNQNFWQASPKWNEFEVISYAQSGRYFEHALEGFFSRKLIHSNRLQLLAGLGVSLNFVPANRDDENDVPTDSLFRGSIIQFDSDSNIRHEMQYYGRFVTSFYGTLNGRLMANYRASKRLTFTVAAIYRQGFFAMFKSDFWYVNYLTGETGSGQMINRGTAYGIELGLRYNIRKF